MIYKEYSYSPVTKSKATATVPWIEDKKDKWYSIYGSFHTGIDIQADKVYSYASGVALHIGTEGSIQTVTVQYDVNISFRYANLKSVSVRPGQILQEGELIGAADKYVHFEFISPSPNQNSMWIVRVGKVTYYKYNPELVFNGVIKLKSNDWSQITEDHGYYDPNQIVTPSMENEFNSNNIDVPPDYEGDF